MLTVGRVLSRPTVTGWDLPTVSCIAARCSALAAAGGINLPTPGPQIGPGRSRPGSQIWLLGGWRAAWGVCPGDEQGRAVRALHHGGVRRRSRSLRSQRVRRCGRSSGFVRGASRRSFAGAWQCPCGWCGGIRSTCARRRVLSATWQFAELCQGQLAQRGGLVSKPVAAPMAPRHQLRDCAGRGRPRLSEPHDGCAGRVPARS